MRVLIVEDYEPLRISLVQGLTEAGFAVDATGDGIEGQWYAADEAYDVIILDLMLPGLDGLSLLKSIREAGKNSPVLILSAKGEISDRVAGLNDGADDYLPKPFAFDELLARVNALVRRKYDARANLIEVNQLTIDLVAKDVRNGEASVSLTAREYTLLEFMAMRKGEVVSRTEIMEHLYGFDSEPNSNVIDVHIAQLRKKLGQGEQFIQTRRGLGYVFGK